MAKAWEQRFWSKVQKTANCWNWAAGLKGHGRNAYPSFDGRVGTRVLWERMNGPIPLGLVVMHICDNPKCVRPEHLKLGSMQENMQDASKKGRMSRVARGASAANAAKTHCKNGHPLSGKNLYVPSTRKERICKACSQERWKVYYERKQRLGTNASQAI